MCRLLVFKGTEPIQISHLVTKPAHSIINQAFDSRLRLDATRAVNGDGFGVGWYDADMAPNASSSSAVAEASTSPRVPNDRENERAENGSGNANLLANYAGGGGGESSGDSKITAGNHPCAPCIFTSVTPAWNNSNLHRLAEKIKSPLIFAHVRASTSGALSETNCHPWRYGRLMWMHNGQISCFSKIKRRLVAALPEELFLYPQGHTDSEHAFCVFLSHLPNPLRAESFSWRELREAMLKTINSFNTWAKEVDASEPSLMNFVVSDGESVVCTRYINSRTDEAASLYFSSGTSFYEDTPGQYRMVKADKREKIIVVASEPLTFEKADWIQIPTNTLVTITPKMNVLQQPIEDEFSTNSNEAAPRTPHFALKSGYQPNVPVGHAAFRDDSPTGEIGRGRSSTVPPSVGRVPERVSLGPLNGTDMRAHPAPANPNSNAAAAEKKSLAVNPTANGNASHRRLSNLSLQSPTKSTEGGQQSAHPRVGQVAADALVSRLRAPTATQTPPDAGHSLAASQLAPPGPDPESVKSANGSEQRSRIPFHQPSGRIRLVTNQHAFVRPTKRIVSQAALKRFEESSVFDEILSFNSLLNEAIVGKKLREKNVVESPAVRAICDVLATVDRLVDETPADKSSGSRFGNSAFRTFYQKVKSRMEELHSGIPSLPAEAVEEISIYLEESWGNEKRIDYGSGMELNFACWLLCLVKLGVLDLQRDAQAMVLKIFWDYMRVMRKIQSTYWLEPAGSHGVWGLDDYHFLPFLWGSGQLRDHKHLKPKSIHDKEILDEFAEDYMYFACIKFINSIKTASLRWHSPMLDDISGVKTWGKVNEGMQKMYRAEVLLKLPIAQHIFFGSLLEPPSLPEGEDEEVAEEDEHGHIHGQKHGTGEGQAAGWGDCCGIPIPSAFAAAEQEKTESKTASAYAQRVGSTQSAIRRIPFD